jgi:small subunit ribosomal protein S20
MANHKSAIKRIRQIQRRSAVNQVSRGKMRTQLKKFGAAAEAGDAAVVEGMVPATMSALDKAVQKGLIKKGRADRLKSRLTLRANKLKSATA